MSLKIVLEIRAKLKIRDGLFEKKFRSGPFTKRNGPCGHLINSPTNHRILCNEHADTDSTLKATLAIRMSNRSNGSGAPPVHENDTDQFPE